MFTCMYWSIVFFFPTIVTKFKQQFLHWIHVHWYAASVVTPWKPYPLNFFFLLFLGGSREYTNRRVWRLGSRYITAPRFRVTISPWPRKKIVFSTVSCPTKWRRRATASMKMPSLVEGKATGLTNCILFPLLSFLRHCWHRKCDDNSWSTADARGCCDKKNR